VSDVSPADREALARALFDTNYGPGTWDDPSVKPEWVSTDRARYRSSVAVAVASGWVPQPTVTQKELSEAIPGGGYWVAGYYAVLDLLRSRGVRVVDDNQETR
jgi:hypothetical protein